MKPIIITAFWDVGRGDMNAGYTIPRSNERYYEEFKVWAKIKNRMIAYSDSAAAEQIIKIRREYGLEQLTEVIIIDDVFFIEPDIFNRMREVESKAEFKSFRYIPDAMSNVAKFDYAWMMKYWCLSDAAKRVEAGNLFAWMDFGFNHKDKCFTKEEEFSFEWDCDASLEKIHVFSLTNVDNILSINSLKYLEDTMLGVIHLVPQHLSEKLWLLIKDAMNALLMLDCIDDDQQLLLMAIRKEPELFEVHISDWFLPLKEFGGSHLTVRLQENQNIKKGIRIRLREFYQFYKYVKREWEDYKRLKNNL